MSPHVVPELIADTGSASLEQHREAWRAFAAVGRLISRHHTRLVTLAVSALGRAA